MPSQTRRIVFVIVVLLVGLGAGAWCCQSAVRGWLGPPSVTLREAYAPKPEGLHFDHALFDAVLRGHVDERGWVDYTALKTSAARLDEYLASLAEAPLDELGRNEKLALLINAYNACTLRLILDHYPLDSIKDIPAAQRWDAVRWRIGGRVCSLNQIEHEQIRPRFREPRIHFALVCAAVGCPPLRSEAYTAQRIEAQLEDQTRIVHANPRWFRFDKNANVVHLTPLYDWYGEDFAQVAGSVLPFAARYSLALRDALAQEAAPRIVWMNYVWRLNDIANAN